MQTPLLSIEEYDALERIARGRASYPALRTFAPVAFAQVNFPVRVSAEHELRRYADIMHEVADRRFWLEQFLCSAAESSLIVQLRSRVQALTESLFLDPVEPFMCLFPPLPILRVIEAVRAAQGNRPLTVLEIGPGSGYFAGYALLSGHRYMGTDITQALYLWQHRLLRWLSDGDLEDFAFHPEPPDCLPERKASLLPWWHFAKLYKLPPLPIDVIVCDAAMGEMDPLAMRYVIRLGARLLEKSSAGLFLFSNIGEERLNRLDTVQHVFQKSGYRYTACGSVHVQVASPTGAYDFVRALRSPPPIALQPNERLAAPSTFLTVNDEKRMDSYAFFDFLRLSEG